MSDNDLQAELERLRAENARLKGGQSRVSLKVGAKGGVSLYGLGRFPVTLYKEQWVKLLDMADDIRAFLQEHDAELKAKKPGRTRAKTHSSAAATIGVGITGSSPFRRSRVGDMIAPRRWSPPPPPPSPART